ncbi:MAG: Xaa-Pro peptidase family protein [Minwuia sp.]|nr:Xaa-Pro peptidase family protein [Minwuia sp.]
MSVFHHSAVDRVALRQWRLDRVRAQLRKVDVAGALLTDPVNIRYATDSTNMQVWTLHNTARYCFIATDGPVVLFDFAGCAHLSADNEAITETRPATAFFFFGAGPEAQTRARKWGAEIEDLVTMHGGGNRRIAVDTLEPLGVHELCKRGIEICHGQSVMELARAIKNDVELSAMQESIDACEEGMRRMRAVLEPGITETALWSRLHQANIEFGGEWIETRLLTSGPRTNPWFQECGNRVIEAGDMVSFDTDLVGPNGYCADISRSWICGDVRPSNEQRWLYATAFAQIEANIARVKPGLTFREFSAIGSELPADCVSNRYCVVAHGVGLCDEYPAIVYDQDFATGGYEGVIEAGMTLCIESLIGREGGRECVKLEEQVLVTETGARRLSTFEYEEDWL